MKFILKTKCGHERAFNQNYLPFDGSVSEVYVLVRCNDEKVQPIFCEFDPKANTLNTYQEASVRVRRKPGGPESDWGQLRDGWRVFQFVVCKGPQPRPTKAAHTVHRFLLLGYPHQQEGSSCCSPPPQQLQDEMEPLLIDTIRQLQQEKEDLVQQIRVPGSLFLSSLSSLSLLERGEEEESLSQELQELRQHSFGFDLTMSPPNKRRKFDDDPPPFFSSPFSLF